MFIVTACYVWPFLPPHLSPQKMQQNSNQKNSPIIQNYIFFYQKVNCENERLMTALLEGMKMALQFVLGPYTLLFVVIAAGKIFRNY